MSFNQCLHLTQSATGAKKEKKYNVFIINTIEILITENPIKRLKCLFV